MPLSVAALWLISAQALFARLNARMAGSLCSRVVARGDKAENYPISQVKPGNDFYVERERREKRNSK